MQYESLSWNINNQENYSRTKKKFCNNVYIQNEIVNVLSSHN